MTTRYAGRLAALAACIFVVHAIHADELCGRAAGQLAAEGRRFDPIEGRDPRNYPPDPQVRFEHLRLELDFEDLTSRSFRARETISFTTLEAPLPRLELDALDLDIEEVADASGQPLTTRYDDRRLTIRFDPPLAPRTPGEVHIRYACREPKAGMYFALPDEGYPARPLMIHTQGEAIFARNWFVCHDSPNARCTSEMLVTIPDKYLALSNGQLVADEKLDGGRRRFHYRMEQPHAAYLVSLVIGEFAVVREQWHGRPVEYWVPPGQEGRALATFGKTPEMLELYSTLTGFEYPYAKYSQAVCYLFNWGGMENISATTMHENIILDERAALDQDEEGLIAHELAHQWFGDLLTCETWAHLWLNEGFATYMTPVWFEHARGADEYVYRIWGTLRGAAAADQPDLRGGLVWPYYDHPDDTFSRGPSNPYGKGASVLHILRRELGDELFWRCIQEYVRRNAWKTVESDDLRSVVEELSGRSFERFFQQWVERSGVPSLRISYEWNDAESEAVVSLEQTQPITETAPAMAINVHVWLMREDGTVEKRVVEMGQRTARLALRCAGEPRMVCIDPELALLARVELELPASMVVRLAREGPTLASRLYAVRELAQHDRSDARGVLKDMLLDESAFWGLRCEAADALARMQHEQAREALLAGLREGALIREHRVRRAAVDALGRYRSPRVAETLIRLTRHDATYSVESAAARALGGQEVSDEVINTLLACAQKPSRGDVIRSAAVAALGDLGDPRGIDAALALAEYGQPYRSRPAGVAALGRLGQKGERRAEIRRALLALVSDPQNRTADAAVAALGVLGDEEAIPDLERFAGGVAPENRRRAARDAVAAIRRKQGETAVLDSLRSRVEELEKARERLERKLGERSGE